MATLLLHRMRPAAGAALRHLPRRCCAHSVRRLHQAAAIERQPREEELAFARRVAAAGGGGGGGNSAEEISRAAWTAMQVLRLEPSERDDGGGVEAWSVPLAMLLRSLVEYPRWLVPTSSIGQQEVLQTLIDQRGQPLLVACAGQENLEAAPSPAGETDVGIRGVRTMPGIELVYRWHAAQLKAAAAGGAEAEAEEEEEEGGAATLSGAVLNPSAEGGADAVLNEMVLPHLVSIAAAQRVEAALGDLADWIPEPVAETAPNEALEVIDGFDSFTALLHIAPDGEQRLHTSASGEALLFTGADLAARASELLLQTHAADLDGEWRTVRVALRAVVQASIMQEGSGVEFVYGWSSTANAAETITLRFPSAQLLVDLFGAANCDLLSKGGLRKDKPTAPGL
jgi:hypothetical protein